MKVKDLLSDASKWTQGAAARDKWGKLCSPLSPDAECYCVLGALERAYPADRQERLRAACKIRDAIVSLGWKCKYTINVGVWNDAHERTFDDIQKALEKADV
jgi:hypothetical protein